MGNKIEIVQVNVNSLKPATYNPRKWSESAITNLKESIQSFGLIDPIIANSAPKRKNVVIGGHFRLHVAKQLGYKEVPVVYICIPDVNKEKELNLRLNKNQGEWDMKLLAEFDEGMLSRIGFEEDEMKMMFSMSDVADLMLDPERMKVITIEPPEAPILSERLAIYCDDIKQYNVLKKYFGGSRRIKADKLLELILC